MYTQIHPVDILCWNCIMYSRIDILKTIQIHTSSVYENNLQQVVGGQMVFQYQSREVRALKVITVVNYSFQPWAEVIYTSNILRSEICDEAIIID